jgi:D-alanine--poly(phosphoribitol) ligase subunit 2
MLRHESTHVVISKLLREKLGIDVPTLETDLFETGIMDSLAFVELTIQLEETFGIIIPMEKLQIEDFRSIAMMIDFIHRHTLSQESQNTDVQ